MTDDLRDRMLRTAAGTASSGPTVEPEPPTPLDGPPPAQARPRPYPRRVTLDLTEEDHRALRVASLDRRVPMAELLRELVRQWRLDAERAHPDQEDGALDEASSSPGTR